MDRYSILVLALGNDDMGDDSMGLAAARPLLERFGEDISIVAAPVAGFTLIDFLEGYTHILILDTVVTGKHPVGSVVEYSKEDFQTLHASSPNFVGIPEAITISESMNHRSKIVVRILAVEIDPPGTRGSSPNPVIEKALPMFIDRASDVIIEWADEDDSFTEFFGKA